MTIWVVEHGEYSDRHVVAVTDSRDTAEAIAALGSSGTATPYEINEIADRLRAGYRVWDVTFLLASGSCLEVSEGVMALNIADCEPPTLTSYPNPPSLSRDVLYVEVAARDRAEALKIAGDKRLAWLSTYRPDSA